MNETAKELLQQVITKWKFERRFTYENKQVIQYNSPISDGEFVLRFTNSLNSFFCNKETIEIALTSRPFHTATLSENPLSENPNGDKDRLLKFLEQFDNDFYAEVEKKLNDCLDTLNTSDPLFF